MFNTKSLRTPAVIEAAIIFGIAVILLAFFISIDAFEYVVHLSDDHESWELDEILVTLMVMPIAFGIYAWRRLNESRTELRLRREAEAKAEAMALHDPLTGLPNRRKAALEIGKALRSAASRNVTLMIIDLNRFKAANDLHGHAIGDQVLLESGERLTELVGPDGLVSRQGGDEFVVMLCGAPRDEGLISCLDAISEIFERPFDIEGLSVTIGASIGVTQTDDPEVSIDLLMSQADAAMYRAKGKGRNGYCFFEQGMELAARYRAQVESELRGAIAEGTIVPHYQPLVRLQDGTVVGFEALARWKLDDGTFRAPAEFIPIAEESGLISDLYYSVLRQGVEAMRSWPPHWRLSVNISPAQFNDELLVEHTLHILTEAGIPPGRLDVEITETALVSDIDQARKIIRALQAEGIHVVLDDFGTGYSSLRHLNEMKFDKLKIDRSFVTEIEHNASSQTIVRAITSMAHNLGLKVTVEGIETQEEADSVISYGCDLGQGNLYGRAESGTVEGPLLPEHREELHRARSR